jgi:C2 domain/MUN domain
MSAKVARRAVSRGTTSDRAGSPAPSWKPLNRKVTDHSLYPYLLRLAILSYRTQPRFRYSGQSGYAEDRLTPTHSRSQSHSRRSSQHENLAVLTPENSHNSLSSHLGHHSSNSWSGTSSPASGDALSFSSKVPKETLKLLLVRFKAIALKVDHESDDPLLRRSYLAYYAMLLTPDFMKRMKESRRAEDLVMMFLSCAAKELNKLAVSPSDLRGVVDKHAAAFVQLLIGVIREAGGSSSSPLINQLESYRSSLENDTVLSVRNTNSDNGHHSQQVGPTFSLPDMFLAQDLGKLLLVADSELQRDIENAKDEATEVQAVGELRFIEQELVNHHKHPVYGRQDFSSVSEFEFWRESELEAMSQQINHFSNGQNITTVCPPQIHPDTGDYEFYYFPPDSKSYYRHLLKRCLERDTRAAGRELSHDPQSATVLLSKHSTDLLTKAASVWRIPAPTRGVLLLDVAEELFSDETLSIAGVKDSFSVAKYICTDAHKREMEPASWPASDRMLYSNVLTALQAEFINRVGTILENVYAESPPKIGPLLEILEEYVFSQDRFDGYATFLPTEIQIDGLKDLLISVAERKYDELIDNIPRDNTLDLLHIIDLADKLIAIAKRLSKRYKMALFGELKISFVSTERHLSLFSADSQSMFNHLMTHTNEDPSFEDIVILYKKLVEIRDLFEQVNSTNATFSFKIEETFYPFIIKWAESSSDLAVSWVDPAIESDKFLPIDVEAGALNSSSVNDIFTSFNSGLSLIRDFHWKNQVHVAQLHTILLKGISSATSRYANRLFQLFMEELRAKDDEANRVKSRQDKWIAMAKTAVNFKEKFVPYNFLSQTFVKLNDIELAQKNLDRIENDIDSEQQFARLGQTSKNSKRSNSFIFTVRIVEAEGLKACDMNGLSDPYVTLIDQKTRKSIGKTRTIYEDLNPIWDETFEIVTSGPKWLTATIWDENSITNHDLCGRAFIRLDPSAFEDFVSQVCLYCMNWLF